jgi:hypothetical protein
LSAHERTAEERAEALLKRLKPQLIAAMEKHRAERSDLKFDEIESNSAGVGDLLARLLIQEALKEQAAATESEIEAARQGLANEAREIGKTPDQLRMTRMPARVCEVGTVRGPVPHQREYLYFPELKRGVFPPRPAVKHP